MNVYVDHCIYLDVSAAYDIDIMLLFNPIKICFSLTTASLLYRKMALLP